MHQLTVPCALCPPAPLSVQLVIQTCHKRGVHAIGGMSALIPVKDNPAANEVRRRRRSCSAVVL